MDNKNFEINDKLGEDGLNISENVINSIVNQAAGEVEGIVGFSGSITSDIEEFFGKKDSGKGVKAVVSDNKIMVDVSLIIKYGYIIPDIAKKVQEKIKQSVETMTGHKILQVNIYIEGIEY